jgi:hypothetical protein
VRACVFVHVLVMVHLCISEWNVCECMYVYDLWVKIVRMYMYACVNVIYQCTCIVANVCMNIYMYMYVGVHDKCT